GLVRLRNWASYAPSSHIGIATRALCPGRIFVGRMLVPRNHPGHAPHHEDSGNADQGVHEGTAGNLGQHEMPCEGQEDAETEYLKRMLAAQDQWSQPGRFQLWPIP